MLKAPAKNFSTFSLPVCHVCASSLVRISWHTSNEPYFGRSGKNRFDAPHKNVAARYATCYLGTSLEVAFAETVLHNEVAQNGGFQLALSQQNARHVVTLAQEQLLLADLTGPYLKALGADGSLSTVLNYAMPQRWSKAVHAHPMQVDGFRYVSRHMNTGFAVVLFDRAAARLRAASYTPLGQFNGAAGVFSAFNVSWI